MNNKYEVVALLKGYDNERDNRLLESLSKESLNLAVGSGFCLSSGVRDLCFSAESQEAAYDLKEEIEENSKKLGITDVNIKVYSPKGYDVLTSQELEDLKNGCQRSPHVPSETVKRLIHEVEYYRRQTSKSASETKRRISQTKEK